MGQDPLIGKVFHDTHEIVRLIGEGGMGAVYEARHRRLKKQRFAIKVLHAKMADDPKIMRRFQREAEIVAEIGHPNIVYITDFYETDEGQPYMVMEYLDGEDLAACLERRGKLPPGETLEIVRQVGSALAAVHKKGIVHRDLKPANIFLVPRPEGGTRVKVLDFGISKIRDSGTKLTGTQAVLGTPQYMSPEQGEGLVSEVDHRSDIFTLGTITYEMLSGQVPFDAHSMMGIIRAVCDRPHPAITARAPELGPEVERVLDRALAKDREDRFGEVSELVEALSAALAGVEATPSVAPEEPATPPAAAPVTAAARVTEMMDPEPARPPHDPRPATEVAGIDEVLGIVESSPPDLPVRSSGTTWLPIVIGGVVLIMVVVVVAVLLATREEKTPTAARSTTEQSEPAKPEEDPEDRRPPEAVQADTRPPDLGAADVAAPPVDQKAPPDASRPDADQAPKKPKLRIEPARKLATDRGSRQRIYFATNSYRIPAESRRALRAFAEEINSNAVFKKMSIRFEGHTDSRESNQRALSLRRARAVKRYLVAQGVDADRISIRGYGADRPININRIAKGRSHNRRVDFLILKK